MVGLVRQPSDTVAEDKDSSPHGPHIIWLSILTFITTHALFLTQALATLYPIRLNSTYTHPPYPGDPLIFPTTPPSARILVACAHSRTPTSPHHHDCLDALTRVPGPPFGVTRLGSPASPRIHCSPC